MNHARHLLSVNGVFKIQAKEGKTPKKQTNPVVEQTIVVEQKPIQPPVTQPIVQPIQPVKPPVTQSPFVQPQPPVTQSPFIQPVQPVNPYPFQPMYPQQPQQPSIRPVQPPVMAFGSTQPQLQPFAMNQPMTQASGVPRNVSPLVATTTPTKTLTNSVTMQQPHPLNSSFSSPSVTSQSPVQQPPVVNQPPLVSQPVQPQQSNVDPHSLATLRSFGFPVDDSVLIKVLQETNGDINAAVTKMLEQ
ncbi:hypothetical protein NAEGRDRAFT_79696 [Naegleria gruberi]|uniref:UBA domain-containing protein n=1 Tax=Naegleria gruberi TaxID=5762 RepID=D2VEY1_NAEGR|nr:uncharacterized protein NAEGRDRAFT_79696 [Naegleria gruberi]EFC44681.1 hypothetical protein NAEGRDRAFT_79696 [Naegleria gruberi]|eukprot:XP_002677425.1 hypothetical protein NAEGRDRAFT_79696 [Naegleria gruberi strain NEG-M]